MNVSRQIHECGAPDTWMWRARYMNVACQIHECGAPGMWIWHANYFILLAALATFAAFQPFMYLASQLHEYGAPDTWMWRARHMNVTRQIHESGVPIILFFTCSPFSNSYTRRAKYMNVARQIHECGTPIHVFGMPNIACCKTFCCKMCEILWLQVKKLIGTPYSCTWRAKFCQRVSASARHHGLLRTPVQKALRF